MDEPVIGRYAYIDYTDPADAFRPYDPAAIDVAARVARLIESRLAGITVEHIGSTAIPGCDGKGVVDLMLLYPPGRLSDARCAVDRLGFQLHAAPGAFPESRPVMLGSVEHGGTAYRLHVHLLAGDADEVTTQRTFRDRLRADPALVAEYVAQKRAVLERGIATSAQYNDGKDAFIKRAVS